MYIRELVVEKPRVKEKKKKLKSMCFQQEAPLHNIGLRNDMKVVVKKNTRLLDWGCTIRDLDTTVFQRIKHPSCINSAFLLTV